MLRRFHEFFTVVVKLVLDICIQKKVVHVHNSPQNPPNRCIPQEEKKSKFELKEKMFSLLQVNLCQKHLFLDQLTHNMTKDCSLIYQFSTWKLQAQNIGRTCCVQKLFWMSKQKQKTICVHNMFWACSFHVLNW